MSNRADPQQMASDPESVSSLLGLRCEGCGCIQTASQLLQPHTMAYFKILLTYEDEKTMSLLRNIANLRGWVSMEGEDGDLIDICPGCMVRVNNGI